MRRDFQEPTVDEHDSERHPAWATIGASRVSHGGVGGGTHLFDSDVLHQHTVQVTIRQATRNRDLGRDWIHGSKDLATVELSEAQWASFVSAMNSGTGVPCTLRYTRTDGETPDFPHSPRLAQSIKETHEAADKAFGDIRDAYTRLEQARTPKEKRDATQWLGSVINNSVPNVDFAGKQLIEHAEGVVAKSKADIEAYVIGKAHQLGIAPADLGFVELLPSTPRELEATSD